MPSVLELMRPSTIELEIHGARAVAESLSLLEWMEHDGLLTRCLVSLLTWCVADALKLIGEANKLAARLPASVSAKEGLAAFAILAKLNELRYIDPALSAGVPTHGKRDRALASEPVVDIVNTLARRFSMQDIREMTPEWALLCWQQICEDVARDRNTIFYASDYGYTRRSAGKTKYKMIPRKSPHTPFWVKQRAKMDRPSPVVPRMVLHPEKVVDAMSGLTLEELGEIEKKE